MSFQKIEIKQPLPDPFCLATPKGYYLTGTETSVPPGAAGFFDLFFSPDASQWKRVGKLLVPPEGISEKDNFWAPELLCVNGRYYLYYTADSNGNPYQRFVRAAMADSITGPFRDIGPLTRQPAIDGHPFRDSDGTLWMIYTGNEGNDYMGQLIIDKMISPDKLEGCPRKIFENETVEWEEGTFIFQFNGRLILLSSQGNWRDETYHILAAARDGNGRFQRLMRDGKPFRLLESAEGRSGPGHCSVFTGPGKRPWLCFHAWDAQKSGRYPWIAPIVERDGTIVAG